MNGFCTYCDEGYAARMLCLHDSLRAQAEPFALHVLCFDKKTEAAIAAVGASTLVAHPWDELLAADPEYAALRGQRSRVEMYFTTTPVFVRHCLQQQPDAGAITYLDADLYFFGPASRVFEQQGGAAIGIVPHRFPPRLRHLESHGIYNVAWVSFRRNAEGLAAAGWWRQQCLAWCRDEVDGGRYADQGYLNEFPRRFEHVRVLSSPGVNAAPWNVDGLAVTQHGDEVRVAGEPLLFYHFQGVRELFRGWFDPGLLYYSTPMTAPLREYVYQPYLNRLMANQAWLEREAGVQRQIGYHRLPAGASLRQRIDRWAMRRALPVYRRLRGQLLAAHLTTSGSNG